MRLLFFFITFLLSTNTYSSECHKTIAAFDIGSGSTKMKVAKVNTCLQKIEKMLLESDRAVAYKEDLNKSSSFSPSIMKLGIQALKELKSAALPHSPTQYLAVATSAFRSADNASTFITTIKKETDISVKVIDQRQEAILGFLAGSSRSPKEHKNTLVWDIGGGSMQITSFDGKNYNVYEGKVASVSFKDMVISKIQKKNNASSPNPLKLNQANMARDLAKTIAQKEVPSVIKSKIANKKSHIVGIGGVHFYSVRQQINLQKKSFNQKDIENALKKRAGMTDSQLESKYASTEITNLCLVLGFMKGLGIKEVWPEKINMADGILLAGHILN